MVERRLLELLVCPVCRHDTAGPSGLARRGADLECVRCRANYPAIGATHSVLREPVDQPKTSTLLEQYVLAQFPDRAASRRLAKRLAVNQRLMGWIDRALTKQGAIKGRCIELGCGPGAYGAIWRRHAAFTVLVDIRQDFAESAAAFWARDKRVAALHADAHDPPFRAACFALAAALNVLDATTEPWLLLGQMDALLKPGGLALITLPYSANLGGPDELLSTLAGGRAEIPHLSYDILASKDWIPWVIPTSERLVMEYQVHAVLARKRGQR